jgi:16S rRNA G966 N2-methylase RsmD
MDPMNINKQYHRQIYKHNLNYKKYIEYKQYTDYKYIDNRHNINFGHNNYGYNNNYRQNVNYRHDINYIYNIDYTKLFLEPPDRNYKNLQIDRESLSYITTPHNAIAMSWIIRNNLDNLDLSNITIFDGTACVGGDVIVFGHIFNCVIGCEIDFNRFRMLENNVNVYDLNNVTVMNEDCLKLIFDMDNLDIIYLDPPWGGKDYKKKDSLTLSIGDKSVESIVNTLLDPEKTKSKLKLIVLKLPKNYDIKQLFYETSHNNATLMKYELEKMLVMVFKIN